MELHENIKKKANIQGLREDLKMLERLKEK